MIRSSLAEKTRWKGSGLEADKTENKERVLETLSLIQRAAAYAPVAEMIRVDTQKGVPFRYSDGKKPTSIMEPPLKTLKRLFALSRNRCAFPICATPIVEVSGIVTGIVCHISARSKGGPRYIAELSDEQRHAYANLMLLCARHSKLIDSDPAQYTIEVLSNMKERHEQRELGPVEMTSADALAAELLLKEYQGFHITAGGHVMVHSPGSVQASSVVIKNQNKRIAVLPPAESVASSLSHRNYVKHLIDRYQEFASKQPGRKFRYPAIYDTVKRRYGAKWDFVSLRQFNELVLFLHQRIDRTMLGSVNRGKGIPNYSAFDEYRTKYETKD